MVTKLLVPERRIVVPKPPSYLNLDMAFAIGAGTQLMDKSRYRSHATISGADWADGAHGRCLDFVAASKDYVEIPAAYDQLDFTSEDFSIIIRYNVDTLAIHRELFMRASYNSNGYRLVSYNDGSIRFQTYQVAAIQESSTAVGQITTGSWVTVGISRSGAAVTILKNGVDITDTSGSHINPVSSPRSAKIGIFDDKTSQPFDGKIEFLRIFGGIALSASAHLAYHNALA